LLHVQDLRQRALALQDLQELDVLAGTVGGAP
jgi:hypothetical protein